MSYRTYILEKELAEVKAERDALLLKIAEADDARRLNDREEARQDRHEEAERQRLEYYGQPEDRDYPDEKTGED